MSERTLRRGPAGLRVSSMLSRTAMPVGLGERKHQRTDDLRFEARGDEHQRPESDEERLAYRRNGEGRDDRTRHSARV